MARSQHPNRQGDIRFVDPSVPGDWPLCTPPGIRRYLSALHNETPVAFAENAVGVTARILRVGDRVLPVLISDGKGGKASILSPYAHHISYPVEEIARQSRYLNRTVLRLALTPLIALFKLGQLDRVVHVNHWLLSGTPEPDLPVDVWPAVVAFLAHAFPGHAVLVPDVKPSHDPQTATALRTAGGQFVPTRQVYIADPTDPLAGTKLKKRRYARNQALRLIEETAGDLVPHDTIMAQVPHLRALYHRSNVSRHSALNPLYTRAFFDLALTCDEFKIQAWRHTGADQGEDQDRVQITAFNLQRLDHRFIHWSTFGAVSKSHPANQGKHSLYERVAAADLATAQAQGLLLDWGAGASEFKRLRGARPYPQYEVAFTAHLGPLRRLAWRVLSMLRQRRMAQLSGT